MNEQIIVGEVSRNEVLEKLPNALNELNLAELKISGVYLYGSTVKGTASSTSDIDLAFMSNDYERYRDMAMVLSDKLDGLFKSRVNIKVNNRALHESDKNNGAECPKLDVLFIDEPTFIKRIAGGFGRKIWRVDSESLLG